MNKLVFLTKNDYYVEICLECKKVLEEKRKQDEYDFGTAIIYVHKLVNESTPESIPDIENNVHISSDYIFMLIIIVYIN